MFQSHLTEEDTETQESHSYSVAELGFEHRPKSCCPLLHKSNGVVPCWVVWGSFRGLEKKHSVQEIQAYLW